MAYPIEVKLTDEELDRATLRVTDDGIEPRGERSGGSGGRLMQALAAQIGARIETSPVETGGTMVEATWRLRLARAAAGRD